MLTARISQKKEEYLLGQEANHRPISFLQSYEYGQMQKMMGNEPIYLVFENEAGTIVSSLLLILFKAKRGTYLFAPYGVHNEEQIPVILDVIKEYSRVNKVDFLRLSPLMDDSQENRDFFRKYGFRNAPVHMMHPELLWQLDITKSEKELLNDMRKNTRYAVRQAEKMDIKIESGTDLNLLKDFYLIHEETSRRQHFVPYPWSYLEAQLKIFGPKDQVKVFVAEHEGKKIAGAVIMYYGQEGVYHHGASLSEYNKIPASYAIQWEAIREAKRRGLTRYNFWGVVDNAPKHPWAGLSFFKKGFGGEGQSIIHCQDLPLSLKYWFNWAVETYRRKRRGY